MGNNELYGQCRFFKNRVVGAGSKPARNYEANMAQGRFGTCPYGLKETALTWNL
jgi:hypothetical protein